MSTPLRWSTGGLWPSWWPTLEPLRLTYPPCTTNQVPVLLTLQYSGQNTAVLTDVCPFCNSRPPILPEVGSSDRPSRHQVRDQRLRQGQSQCADEGRGSEHKSATIVLERRQWGHREVSKNREYYNGSPTKKHMWRCSLKSAGATRFSSCVFLAGTCCFLVEWPLSVRGLDFVFGSTRPRVCPPWSRGWWRRCQRPLKGLSSLIPTYKWPLLDNRYSDM